MHHDTELVHDSLWYIEPMQLSVTKPRHQQETEASLELLCAGDPLFSVFYNGNSRPEIYDEQCCYPATLPSAHLDDLSTPPQNSCNFVLQTVRPVCVLLHAR